jgi:small subunit ribosomal protein S9
MEVTKHTVEDAPAGTAFAGTAAAGTAAAGSSATKAPEGKKSPLGHGTGRRKSAVARVWLRRGNGKLVVNGKEYTAYFDTEITRLKATTPFSVVPKATLYDAEVNVTGGGKWAQADAIKLGIARALLEIQSDLKPLLRQLGLITVDARIKERKKPGQKAARRKFQFVKR